MKKMNLLVKALTAALAVLLMITAAPTVTAEGEDPTVREYEQSISVKKFYSFDLLKGKYDEKRSDIPTKPTLGEVGQTFTAYYPDALDYYGETKSVKVEITFKGYNRYKKAGEDWQAAHPDRKPGIVLTSDKDILMRAPGVDYEINYSFYEDNNFTTPANIYGAVGFQDPDEGNYKYAATTRKLYYIDTKDNYGGNRNLADYYKVTSVGIYHVNEDDAQYGSWIDFNEGVFAVPLENESSFVFTEEAKHDHLYVMAMIIQTHAPYKVEYYYETPDGYPEDPDYTSEEYTVDLYKNSTVSVTDEDKVPNPEKGEGYKLDESKKEAWVLELQPDGSTVLKVYFKQLYTIKYDPNADDAIGEMADDDYTKSDETMSSKETWSYTRPGFEFIGYKVENTGDILTNPEDFKEYLLTEKDREVVLYAQWNPLNYKIKYDKNAEDATGEMKDDDYTGADAAMPSKDDWTFARPGYKFVGYKVENEGETFTDPDDFKAYLLAQEDREVTLFAQWEALPYTIKYDANGGMGSMEDDDYTGADPVMPSKENWTFTREGYDFTGFKLENKGDVQNGSKEFKDTLVADDDGIITLYAQWDPWNYTIKYDANGGKGTMDDDEFVYPDPVMESSKNQFTRKGYKFRGFLYTDPDGNKTLYKNINDFRSEFMKLGKDSEILLVAQWAKIPDTDKYVPPVTGVER